MATQLQVRRGTTAELQSFTGAEGEITVDTDKDTLVVHDGSTAGGHPLLRADQARGWTLTEHFTADGTWTKTGKDGLKRIKVTCWGGGSGGGGGQSGYGASGGSQGGYGYVILDVASVTDNVTVTIGQGGAGAASSGAVSGSGTNTTFGSYITASGATGKNGRIDINYHAPMPPGRITGTNTVEFGAIIGDTGHGEPSNQTFEGFGAGGGPGGGYETDGGSGTNKDAYGVCGAGGGGGLTTGGDGAPGSVLVEEIYGEV